MLNPKQFRELIIRPTLKEMGLWSEAAEELLLGTAAQESHLEYVKQLGKGPALSVFQIEPLTFRDIRDRWLPGREEEEGLIRACGPKECGQHRCWTKARLVWDLRFSCAFARLKYRMDPYPLPDAKDVQALAEYWKRVYNTHLGAGTPAQFVLNYRRVR